MTEISQTQIHQSPQKSRAKFTWKHALIQLSIASIYSAAYHANIEFLEFSVFIFFAAVWLPFIIISIIFALCRRSWKRVLSLVAAIILLWPTLRISIYLAEYAHLAATYIHNVDAINASAATGTPIKFNWKSTGFAGVACSDTDLVYDPRSTVKKETEQEKANYPTAGISYTNLLGDFYILFKMC